MLGKTLLVTAVLAMVAGLCALGALGSRFVELDASIGAGDSSPLETLPPVTLPPPPPAPAVFTRMSYLEARGAARGSGRFLLVQAVSPFSATCTLMDQTTWLDPEVGAWIRQRALAVRVDMVRERARARDLSIKIAPTIIVYSGGREIDRTSGYQSPQQLLRWLEATRERARSR
ncbi:MAG: thioredoxin fold domain-containing protein [Planctomycetota bacterium]